MRKTGWSKLMSPFIRAGRSQNQREEDSLSSKPNVNEEYLEAFRTKSYMEMCNKVEGQVGRTSIRRLSSSSSSALPLSIPHLTEYLLEPRQETLMNMTESISIHYLLLDYFETSLDACHYCDVILEGIHQTRLNYRTIQRAIKLSNTASQFGQQQAIHKELAAFASSRNTLSVVSPLHFRDIHDRYMVLLHKLTAKRRKIGRRLKFKRICKKVGGIGIVISHSALLIALLVFAMHSIVGVVVVPGVMGCLAGLLKNKRIKSVPGKLRTSSIERLGEQIDTAAKGVYILTNDFNTMSRMVKRLQDEVEHRRTVADMCVNNGRYELLKEVVMREFLDHESSFLDQLEELEEHVYLMLSHNKQIQKTRNSRN
ncbi:UPF0496 protein [Quillaja saponaria]|uniref:UPF0496 protein n=1 Tax=Quillaja saponaria TaxID=32244 RepID=A0AAD7LYZ2_QUISA|nr:UPF0496 protein [Quillaja saponaria]